MFSVLVCLLVVTGACVLTMYIYTQISNKQLFITIY